VLVEETVEEERSVADWRDAVEWKLMRLASALGFAKIGRFGGSMHAFSECFRGFERVEAVRRIFGDRTDEVLRGLRVELTWIGGYMWVSNRDGHLVASARYLNEGNKVDVYLDVIHELVHVKQFLEGKELFDERFNYVDRPTEVEAYRIAVEEARRIGLSEQRILEYLKTEWMTDEDMRKLAGTLGIKSNS
jgi:hypothetical protein